jgi:tetratricopeptide (TPR) repeat protein
MSEFDKAVALLERAIEIDPARAGMGLARRPAQPAGRIRAVQACRHAIELDPELADAYNFSASRITTSTRWPPRS